MIGERIAHYEITAKLGEGGMGEVYRATDTKLNRDVALKILPEQFAGDSRRMGRFQREAEVLASLDHPNIGAIHGIEDVGDTKALVLQLIEGLTLGERIQGAPLAVEEALPIALQIAEALGAAHRKGVVHRDIKPANVMVTPDGHVKVLDFGLAKLAEAAWVQAPGATAGGITAEGSVVGTVAYMSPEQARGAQVDVRTDIWSLGVVIYEMMAGVRPFQGEHGQAIIYSILTQQPRPLRDFRDDLPLEVERVVETALQKEREARPKGIAEILESLRSVARAPNSGLKPRTVPAIAVLPFSNMSEDPDQEYFCDGMTEEIINALMHVEGLRVVARTSAFAFKGRQEDVREIGRKLKVGNVVEGGVRRAGRQLRITAQLIGVDDGYHLWSQRYDREMSDIFAIQDEISRAIVNALKIELRIAAEGALVKQATKNLDAYDDYLRAIYCYKLRTRQGNDKAINLLEQATRRDPGFALAYAALAFAYIERFFTYQPRKTWEEKAFVAIEKAQAFDPELAETYVAKGLLVWTKSHRFPHGQAMSAFRRALALKPNLGEGHTELARVLWHVGRMDEAFASLERALDIDPADVKAQFRMGWLQMQRGNYASGLACLRMLPPDSVAEWTRPLMALCHWYLGRKREAAEQMAQVRRDFAENPAALSSNAILLADAGNEDESDACIELAIEKGKHLGHFHHITNNIAAACAIMKRRESALDWLEETAWDGFPCYPWFQVDPCLENIRNEPRFVKLIEELKASGNTLV